MLNSLSAKQKDYVNYLITISKGGDNGVMSLLKTPEDHAQWEANMRWFSDALLENFPYSNELFAVQVFVDHTHDQVLAAFDRAIFKLKEAEK